MEERGATPLPMQSKARGCLGLPRPLLWCDLEGPIFRKVQRQGEEDGPNPHQTHLHEHRVNLDCVRPLGWPDLIINTAQSSLSWLQRTHYSPWALQHTALVYGMLRLFV